MGGKIYVVSKIDALRLFEEAYKYIEEQRKSIIERIYEAYKKSLENRKLKYDKEKLLKEAENTANAIINDIKISLITSTSRLISAISKIEDDEFYKEEYERNIKYLSEDFKENLNNYVEYFIKQFDAQSSLIAFASRKPIIVD